MQQNELPPQYTSNLIRRNVLYRLSQAMLVVAAISAFMVMAVILWTIVFFDASALPVEASPQLEADVGPVLPTATRDFSKPLVGLVSGHAGYDPGAVCDDGLTEAQINRTIALEVIDLLARRGIEGDLLDEFDSRLEGYQADALVSIHADSCSIVGASGYKVARITASAIPEAEDRLVQCLKHEYASATFLPEHPASITDGMTNYHAFREIASSTPGAIIETGFMLEDRFLLEERPKQAARGIAGGILCFLKSQGYDG